MFRVIKCNVYTSDSCLGEFETPRAALAFILSLPGWTPNKCFIRDAAGRVVPRQSIDMD